MTGLCIAMAGIAAAVSIAGIGSAIGIGFAATAAAGVMSEDSKDFGKYMGLVALPGTQGIYGFVIALMWMSNLNLMSASGTVPDLSTVQGLVILFACLPVGLCGLSAIYQGKVCAASINLVAKKPDEMGHALPISVFVEFYAVLGFLISIFAVLYSNHILGL